MALGWGRDHEIKLAFASNIMSNTPRSYRNLWLALFGVIALSFLALGYFGREIYYAAPPIPRQVATADGAVLFTGQDIKDGQNVWQSIGGQEVGTVWGHGAYVAPDWSADWLHAMKGRCASYVLGAL